MELSVASPKDSTNVTEEEAVADSVGPVPVAFIGLGAMGFGMASWLVHEGFSVCGYDVSTRAVKVSNYECIRFD